MAGAPVLAPYLKRAARGIASRLLFHAGCFGPRFGLGRGLVLLYHRVTPAPPSAPDSYSFPLGVRADRFEAQMDYLRRHLNPVPLRTLVDRLRSHEPLPDRAVAVTFDDGYEDNHTLAYPVLRRLAIPATIFLCTGFLETRQAPWWDALAAILLNTTESDLGAPAFGKSPVPPELRGRRLSLGSRAQRLRAASVVGEFLKTLIPNEIRTVVETLAEALRVPPADLPATRPLTWTQVSEMAAGGIAFGAHTVSHPNLTKLSLEEARREMVESKRTIERSIGAPVVDFAYPYGLGNHYDERLEACAREAGFHSVSTARPGCVTAESDPFQLCRVTAPDRSLPESLWKWTKYTRRGGPGAPPERRT